MVSTNLAGGLGNFMFQISAAYSLALDNNDESVFDIKTSRIGHKKIETYISNIFRKINFGQVNPEYFYNETKFTYEKLPYVKNILLNGYFQSDKYFKNNRDKILNLFSIDKVSLDYINNKYKGFDFEDSTSLHVRRGDYKNLPLHHPTCEIQYYKNAIEVIQPKTLLIFSDDIEWCKENFKFYENKIIYIYDNPDYIELWLMSLCKNNIIANSTFSWWAAWLNNNNNKTVVAPNKWFGPMITHEIKDLILEEWIKI